MMWFSWGSYQLVSEFPPCLLTVNKWRWWVTSALLCLPETIVIGQCTASLHGCEAVVVLRIQLLGIGLESHIKSMQFSCDFYKDLGSPATTASFCGVVFPWFFSDMWYTDSFCWQFAIKTSCNLIRNLYMIHILTCIDCFVCIFSLFGEVWLMLQIMTFFHH